MIDLVGAIYSDQNIDKVCTMREVDTQGIQVWIEEWMRNLSYLIKTIIKKYITSYAKTHINEIIHDRRPSAALLHSPKVCQGGGVFGSVNRKSYWITEIISVLLIKYVITVRFLIYQSAVNAPMSEFAWPSQKLQESHKYLAQQIHVCRGW